MDEEEGEEEGAGRESSSVCPLSNKSSKSSREMVSGWGAESTGGPHTGVSCSAGVGAVGGGTACCKGWLRR